MKYYSKGWNIYNFLITPEELKSALMGFHHVEYSRRVPEDYKETEQEVTFEKYEGLYNKLSSGRKLSWKEDWKAFDLLIGFTNDLSKCTYGPRFMDEQNKLYYKLSNFEEPCVGLNIFVLHINAKGKLCSNYSYTQFPESTIGLQLQFPKSLILCQNQEMISCNEIETYNKVYKVITERISEITKKLTLLIDGKEHKTNIRISSQAKEKLGNFYFIKNSNCVIK